MSKKPAYEVRAAASAHADISDIWEWTLQQFGNAAALRYEALIDQALTDLAEDPQRLGAKPRSDLLPGLWLYHLAFSREHVADQQSVKSPRHFVLFRHLQPDVTEIIRILHDSRDLARHLPKALFERELTFEEMVQDIKARNANTDPETLQALIDEAVRSIREGKKNE